ncbi:MAG: hypothetical protein ACLPKT_21485, partial [Methylocella sp.]
PGWELFYGFLAIVLPAISAAVVGIRSYAELQLLAEQSHHALAILLARLLSASPRRRSVSARDIALAIQASLAEKLPS